MRIVRSWPAQIPENRSYVVDDLERIKLEDYDLSPMAAIDDDIVLIEWDLAVSQEDLRQFVEQCRADRDRVRVAPYRLYVTTMSHDPLKDVVWAHRRDDGSHVDEGEPTCAYFGFGLTYFPRPVVEEFRRDWIGHFSDGAFSGWHRNHVTAEVPISWDVRPIHLHYDLRAIAGLPPLPKRRLAVKQRTESAQEAWRADPARRNEVEALLRERDGLLRRGKTDHLAEVDRQLVLRGYGGSND